jgi:hypothetical protein
MPPLALQSPTTPEAAQSPDHKVNIKFAVVDKNLLTKAQATCKHISSEHRCASSHGFEINTTSADSQRP